MFTGGGHLLNIVSFDSYRVEVMHCLASSCLELESVRLATLSLHCLSRPLQATKVNHQLTEQGV